MTCRDTASVLFTSGTTGPATGVVMTHAQTYAIAQEIVDGLRITDRDVFYCFHPMIHGPTTPTTRCARSSPHRRDGAFGFKWPPD